MIRAFATLIVIGASCAGLLAVTDALTRDDIMRQRQARERALAETLLGRPLPVDTDVASEFFGRCPDWLFGRFEANGYAGPIAALALRREDDGLSLRVTSHRETPGIGDFIHHERSSWLPDRDGSTAAAWRQADAVSGATVTSAAIKRLAGTANAALKAEAASCGE